MSSFSENYVCHMSWGWPVAEFEIDKQKHFLTIKCISRWVVSIEHNSQKFTFKSNHSIHLESIYYKFTKFI